MQNESLVDLSIRISDILVAFSILVAILTFVFTQLHSLKKERRQTTLRQLMLTVESAPLHCAGMFLLEAKASRRSITTDNLSPEEHSKVVLILNYYEQLCTSALEEHLDLAITDHLRRATVRRLFDQCQTYIDERREILGQSSLYQNLEAFAKGGKVRESFGQ